MLLSLLFCVWLSNSFVAGIRKYPATYLIYWPWCSYFCEPFYTLLWFYSMHVCKLFINTGEQQVTSVFTMFWMQMTQNSQCSWLSCWLKPSVRNCGGRIEQRHRKSCRRKSALVWSRHPNQKVCLILRVICNLRAVTCNLCIWRHEWSRVLIVLYSSVLIIISGWNDVIFKAVVP